MEPNAAYRIFLVEDDLNLSREIQTQLERYGYALHVAQDLKGLAEEFSAFDPHLVLLDVNLPYSDGYAICREIRTLAEIPILFLSGRSSSMDIVMALSVGGDDYVTKPFAMDVLTAKIGALLRRSYAYSEKTPEILQYQSVKLNLKDNTVSGPEGCAELTRNEFRLLRELMEHSGEILSRDRLMEALWSSDIFVDDNTLTVNINRLRKKLEELGVRNWIVTKKNRGYLIP